MSAPVLFQPTVWVEVEDGKVIGVAIDWMDSLVDPTDEADADDVQVATDWMDARIKSTFSDPFTLDAEADR